MNGTNVRPGDTFVLRDGTTTFWIVLTLSNARDEIAIVSLGPAEPRSAEADIVGPDDHPDLAEESTVRYRSAMYVSVSQLRTARQRGLLDPMSRCSDELLLRVQRGALTSDFTEQGIQRAIEPLLG